MVALACTCGQDSKFPVGVCVAFLLASPSFRRGTLPLAFKVCPSCQGYFSPSCQEVHTKKQRFCPSFTPCIWHCSVTTEYRSTTRNRAMRFIAINAIIIVNFIALYLHSAFNWACALADVFSAANIVNISLLPHRAYVQKYFSSGSSAGSNTGLGIVAVADAGSDTVGSGTAWDEDIRNEHSDTPLWFWHCSSCSYFSD